MEPVFVLLHSPSVGGWPTHRIPGEHLHQIFAPEAVADWLLTSSPADAASASEKGSPTSGADEK
ncbi:hypothetical protein ACFHYQ_18350 [Sphaerimonospora cavernae]|uniref:Uncharacterized protein n=1 Tax=Sphaerimonospora cavernae TaxID=1740611 RepID=A0ABV6U760_9ACTN